MDEEKKVFELADIKISPLRNAVEVISIYLSVGILWIFLSDLILDIFIDDTDLIKNFQLIKGISYVIITGYLFYIIIKRRMDLYATTIFDLRNAAIELRNSNESLKKLEDKLYHLAYYDELTGLLSKNMISRKIGELIKKDPNATLGLIYLDIDDFKHINEVKGHDIGDELIKLIAEELLVVAGPPHKVARFGGDEFAIIISNQLHKQNLIDLINRHARQVKKTFMLGNEEIYVSVSAGVAIYPDDGSNFTELLKAADIALNRAKDLGKNKVVYYNNTYLETLHKQAEISNHLYQAIRNKEFTVHYQPIVSSKDYKTMSVEALVRWIHPVKGVIAPLEFIPISEKTGHIVAITWLVIDESFRQQKIWQNMGYDIDMSVNLSPKVLADIKLVPKLKQAIIDYDIDPKTCIFEITESAVLEHLDEAILAIHAVRSLGFRIALDDFGSGYSSLTYLQRLPIDILKIDRSFTRNINQNEITSPMFKFIIDLAHYLNLEVVAEGIEYDYQKLLVTKLKSDYQQGYLFSRPNLPEELDTKKFKKKRPI